MAVVVDVVDGSGLTSRLRKDLGRVEARLVELAQVGRADMADAVGYQVGGSRRRLRPQLTLLTYYLTADDPAVTTDAVIDAATATEMLHVGTVYHDDVIDQAPTRHGRESVNARWGAGMAILAGDYVVARSFALLAALGQREAVLMAGLACELAEGMVAEMLERFAPERTEESVLSVISKKTAPLMSYSCGVGALQGCRHDACTDAMLGFGHEIGLAYQLMDDVLDMTATREQLGKPVGNDIREGVYTVPLLRALRRDPGIRPLLRPGITDEEAAQILQRVRSSGAIDETMGLIGGHVDRAVCHLRSVEECGRRPEVARFIEEFVRELLSPAALSRPPRPRPAAEQ
ncbi:polyprenyl synthetase family protein [Streptomyces sp. NPDC050636]|uniref:polyprenyl synthetase family protein n=1 Tax=Streptomyces sp. NPDC050636 TaxID=3154510 RepID=UPI00341E2668